MSGLAGILAHHHDPGVYRWHAAFPRRGGGARRRARRLALRVRRRLAPPDPAEFLAAVGEALAFPDHYGQNLDALNDCLRDLPGPTVLLWDGWCTLAREDETAFGAVRADPGRAHRDAHHACCAATARTSTCPRWTERRVGAAG